MGNPVDLQSLIESVTRGDRDHRTLLLGILGLVRSVGAQKGQLGTPPAATAAASGANGTIVVQVTNPTTSAKAPILHEISYSTVKNFSQNVFTLPVSAATSFVIPAPGQSPFIRMRSSFDSSTWNNYQLISTSAVAAGLQSSAAMTNNAPLNQSNFANVDSVANGSYAAIRIYGSTPYRSYPRIVSTRQQTRPSATIVNVSYGSTAVVAFDGVKYRTSPILAGVFDDAWEPVGAVSVVFSGAPVLPTVALVLGSGGTVIGWNVTSQGNGLTGPVTLSINTATGSGATAGTQTIQNGKLISIAAGNPGSAYAGGDTVTVSGGVGAGAAGGGTAIGGNGGRLTAF